MDAGSFIVARLTEQTAAADRIYPLILPEMPTYPAIAYQQVSAVHLHAMGSDAGLVRVRMQVTCWGSTYAEARAVADAITSKLSRYRGTSGGIKVLDVLLDNEGTTYESETQTRSVRQAALADSLFFSLQSRAFSGLL